MMQEFLKTASFSFDKIYLIKRSRGTCKFQQKFAFN